MLRGQPLHPLKHAVQLFTDASNEGWGAHLGDSTAKGVWSPMESRLHINFLELKAVLLALRQFEHLRTNCCNRQQHGGLLHKQARGYEIRLSLCHPVEAPVLVPCQRNCSGSKTHPRLLECDTGRAFQAQSSDPKRVVPLSAGVQSLVFQMGPAPGKFVCDPVQLQTTKVCVSGSGSDSLGGRCPEPAVGSVGGLRLSPSLYDTSGDFKVEGSRLVAE